jgi:hypothetical protein
MSRPSKRTAPLFVRTRPMTAFMRLDFPAPFAPTNRTVSPASTEIETWRKAVMPP